ncbi:MAG: hypothetical protein ACRDSN_21320 [Pseudonocardiaceae bacterium]
MARPWRNCGASDALVAEVNTRWPRRDRGSDGTIGDAAHASRSSDHNPWVVVGGTGVVRARDIDVGGIDAGWLAEHLRRLGAAGDRRLTGGGYVILNRRITTPDFSGWRAYTGTNPHTSHMHVSFSRHAAGFDSRAGWGITAQEDDLTEQNVIDAIYDIHAQLTGSRAPGQYPGYPSWVEGAPPRTVTDAGRETILRLEHLSHGIIAYHSALAARITTVETTMNAIAAKLGVDAPKP